MVGGGPARRDAQRDVSSGSEEAEKFPAVVPAELVHYLSIRRSTAPKRLSICVSTGSRYELCAGGTEGHCAIPSIRKSVCQHRGRDRNCELELHRGIVHGWVVTEGEDCHHGRLGNP